MFATRGTLFAAPPEGVSGVSQTEDVEGTRFGSEMQGCSRFVPRRLVATSFAAGTEGTSSTTDWEAEGAGVYGD